MHSLHVTASFYRCRPQENDDIICQEKVQQLLGFDRPDSVANVEELVTQILDSECPQGCHLFLICDTSQHPVEKRDMFCFTFPLLMSWNDLVKKLLSL